MKRSLGVEILDLMLEGDLEPVAYIPKLRTCLFYRDVGSGGPLSEPKLCGRKFMSEGPWNRQCPKCKSLERSRAEHGDDI